MADNDTTPIVIKPVTPLGLLPPAIAGQYQTASYIVVASFSVRVSTQQDKKSQNSI